MSNEAKQISIVWSVEDVQSIRPDLSDEQAMEVLQEAKNRHDSSIGISWTTLEIWAQELFPLKEVKVIE